MPFYNENVNDLQQGGIEGGHKPDYGTVDQSYIIDGSGVYVTRNSQTYLYGQFELSGNVCYRNGINGKSQRTSETGLDILVQRATQFKPSTVHLGYLLVTPPPLGKHTRTPKVILIFLSRCRLAGQVS